MPGLAVGVDLFGTLEALFAFPVWFDAVFVQNIVSALEREILPFFGHLTTVCLFQFRVQQRVPFFYGSHVLFHC